MVTATKIFGWFKKEDNISLSRQILDASDELKSNCEFNYSMLIMLINEHKQQSNWQNWQSLR